MKTPGFDVFLVDREEQIFWSPTGEDFLGLQKSGVRISRLLGKIWAERQQYHDFLEGLKFLVNKIDFLDFERSFAIRPGVLQILPAIERDWFPYLVDPYGYFLSVSLPGGKNRWIYDCDYGLNKNAVIHRVFDDKIMTSKFLRLAGVPVLRDFLLIREGSRWARPQNSDSAARKFADEVGFPLVFKQNDGSVGRNVFKIRCREELDEKLQQFHRWDFGNSWFLLQEMGRGVDVRVLFLDGEILMAYQRNPAKILGDGVSTVEELLDRFSFSEKKKQEIFDFLGAEWISGDSVLAENFSLPLTFTANVSTGGDVQEFPVSERDLEFVNRVARATGARYFGLDVLTESGIADGVVLEINKMPAVLGASRLRPWFPFLLGEKVWNLIKRDEGLV